MGSRISKAMWVPLAVPAWLPAWPPRAVQGRVWRVTVSSTMAWTAAGAVGVSHRRARSWAMTPGAAVAWTMTPLGVMVRPPV